MTDSERLVELMKQSDKLFADKYAGKVMSHIDEIYEFVADHILADGWTKPPCKVGDMVYVKYYGEIVNAYVTEFEINSKGIVAKVYIDPDTDREYDAEDIFLTREEAEKA